MTEETPNTNPAETPKTNESTTTATESTTPPAESTISTTEQNSSTTAASSQNSQFFEPIGLIEAFKARHSVRTFQKKPFPQQKKQMIAQIITEANSLDTPFESHVEISITGPGLGRMGAVSNEAGFIVQKIPLNQEEDEEEKGKTETPKEDPKIALRKAIIDVSFKLQVAVMKMTQHHISTVWMAGTYNEGQAEERFPGFKVTAVVAFGEEDTPHFMARVIKFFGNSEKRFPFQQLFYDGDNKREITENDFSDNKPEGTPSYPSYMKDFLVSLQSGPSAMNQQGWRFVLAGNGKEVHLFDAKGNASSCYGSGIALANLHLLGEIRGGECTIEVRKPSPEVSPLGGTYIATAVYTE